MKKLVASFPEKRPLLGMAGALIFLSPYPPSRIYRDDLSPLRHSIYSTFGSNTSQLAAFV
jgi:hypothetical protein